MNIAGTPYPTQQGLQGLRGGGCFAKTLLFSGYAPLNLHPSSRTPGANRCSELTSWVTRLPIWMGGGVGTEELFTCQARELALNTWWASLKLTEGDGVAVDRAGCTEIPPQGRSCWSKATENPGVPAPDLHHLLPFILVLGTWHRSALAAQMGHSRWLAGSCLTCLCRGAGGCCPAGAEPQSSASSRSPGPSLGSAWSLLGRFWAGSCPGEAKGRGRQAVRRLGPGAGYSRGAGADDTECNMGWEALGSGPSGLSCDLPSSFSDPA